MDSLPTIDELNEMLEVEKKRSADLGDRWVKSIKEREKIEMYYNEMEEKRDRLFKMNETLKDDNDRQALLITRLQEDAKVWAELHEETVAYSSILERRLKIARGLK